MLDELSRAIRDYQATWEALMRERTDKTFFAGLKPTSVGWKTTDLADFDQRFSELREVSDQIHLGWVNERWLATLHLKNEPLAEGIMLVKLMQRRPSSTDATGLDHLDFYVPDLAAAKQKLAAEPNLKWTEESNGEHCKWLSIWFDNTEAKLRSDTVLDVCIAELQSVRDIITPTT